MLIVFFMFQYVYVSAAVQLFSDDQLRELLETSRRHNLACEVTGLLLYVGGNFIQLLEGRKSDVLATRERIANDRRHGGMITLLEAESAQRDFPDWSMGFQKIDAPNAATLPGYSDFLEGTAEDESRRSGALRLLEFFRDINAKPAKPKGI